MAYQPAEVKTFSGLFLQPNSFAVPDGAMERASNVVISDDNVITKIRGFYTYYDPGSDVLNAVFPYQGKLIGVFTSKAGYFTSGGSSPNITGSLTTLTGESVTVTSERISRAMEQSGNLYVTTDRGVLKLDAYDATIYKAGTPPALDLRGTLDSANGALDGDKAVAYRVLFGRQDANGNTMLGAPSDAIVLTNSKVTGATYTSSGGGPYTVTVTVAGGHNLTTGMSITVSDATDDDADGTYTVTVTGATTFTYSTALGDPQTGSLDYATSRAPILEFSIPSEIDNAADKYFYQVYRSSQVSAAADPFPDYRLIGQNTLTAAELAAKVVFFEDVVDEVLVTYAAELYTNPNSREGEAQANARPPLCDDVTLYKDMAIYAGCIYRAAMDVDVIDPTVMSSGNYVETLVVINDMAIYTSAGAGPYTVTVTSPAHGLSTGQSILVKNASSANADGTYTVTVTGTDTFTYSAASDPDGGALTFGLIRRYVARTWVGNSNVVADSASIASTTVTVNYTAHGLATGDTIYVSNAKGTGTLPSGAYTITVTGADAFTFAVGVAPTTLTNLSFQGVTNGTYPIFTLDASGSAAVRLRATARGLIKAINRDTSSLIYANYVSGVTDTPGQMRFLAKGFTGTISIRASSDAMGAGFSPPLPSSFTAGDQVYSIGEAKPNVLAVSKLLEPEAAPLANQVTVGSRNKAILRVAALRDSLIVLKEEGVFKVAGDSPGNLSATPLDVTVYCVASNSVALLNNQVYALTNQGVVAITDNSVEIISRRIENAIEPIVGLETIESEAAAIAYESDRTYRLSVPGPSDTARTVTYIYNTINDTWTESTLLFSGGVVGPGNVLYMISDGGELQRERKTGRRYDFCGQNYATLVVSVALDGLSAVVTVTVGSPAAGDIIVHDNVISRVRAVAAAGSDWTVTFYKPTNLAASDSVELYKGYRSEVRFSPFHAGLVGRGKHFAQLQIHQRQNNITRLSVQFATQSFGGSEITEWLLSSVSSTSGWGNEPWGFFPFGLADGINLLQTSQAGPIVRIWVPKFAARTTWIQPILTHDEAGEDMQIQALSWSVRAYQERVTK